MLFRLTLWLCLAYASPALAQMHNHSFVLVPHDIPNLPGVQSAASAIFQNQLFVVGGRTDGLHRRQPFAAFLPEGSNPYLFLIDPQTDQIWTASLEAFPAPVREQLMSTNMQFIQDGPWWYLIGGYGFSPTLNDHTTYDKLTAVRLDSLANAMKAGQDVAPLFQQITHANFAVTGGHAGRLGDQFLLVGGHRFEGRYNPMNHPTFVQTYTNEIRRFYIQHQDDSLSINWLPAWTDPVNLHRRDLNVLPQIFPDGQEGMTAFSGVFQQFADLPYLNTVDIREDGHAANNAFQHRLNQYHCAKLAMYSPSGNEMYNVFFGGIAQYFFDANGNLAQDDNVPFVSTIGEVRRNAGGVLSEARIGDMPGLMGAGAELLLREDLPFVAPDIVNLDALTEDTSHIGYLMGGIESDLPNVFMNLQDMSKAHPGLYDVYLVQGGASSVRPVALQAPKLSEARLSPNPASEQTMLSYRLRESSRVNVVMYTDDGREVFSENLGVLAPGEHRMAMRLRNFPAGVYRISLYAGQELQTLGLSIR